LIVDASPFANGDFIALLLITASMLVCSRLLSSDFEDKRPYEKVFSVLLFFLALLLQWLAFEWEIVRFGLLNSVIELHLIYATIVSVLLAISTRFKAWDLLRYGFPIGIFMIGIALLKLMESNGSLTTGYGIWLWPLAFISLYAALYLHHKKERFSSWLGGVQVATVWLLGGRPRIPPLPSPV